MVRMVRVVQVVQGEVDELLKVVLTKVCNTDGSTWFRVCPSRVASHVTCSSKPQRVPCWSPMNGFLSFRPPCLSFPKPNLPRIVLDNLPECNHLRNEHSSPQEMGFSVLSVSIIYLLTLSHLQHSTSTHRST